MTASQCRVARGLLDWTQQDLADAAGVSVITVAWFEEGERLAVGVVQAMEAAFEGMNVRFFDAGVWRV